MYGDGFRVKRGQIFNLSPWWMEMDEYEQGQIFNLSLYLDGDGLKSVP